MSIFFNCSASAKVIPVAISLTMLETAIAAEYGPETSAPGPDYNDIVVMIDEFIIRTHEGPPVLMRNMEITPAMASSKWIKTDNKRLPACNLGELT